LRFVPAIREAEARTMIVDIPTPEELARSSLDLLNMAWDSAHEIIAGLENSQVKEWDDDGSA
jgi:hypothetical protein